MAARSAGNLAVMRVGGMVGLSAELKAASTVGKLVVDLVDQRVVEMVVATVVQMVAYLGD